MSVKLIAFFLNGNSSPPHPPLPKFYRVELGEKGNQDGAL